MTDDPKTIDLEHPYFIKIGPVDVFCGVYNESRNPHTALKGSPVVGVWLNKQAVVKGIYARFLGEKANALYIAAIKEHDPAYSDNDKPRRTVVDPGLSNTVAGQLESIKSLVRRMDARDPLLSQGLRETVDGDETAPESTLAKDIGDAFEFALLSQRRSDVDE